MFGLNKIIPVDSNINFLGLRKNFLIFSILAILISIGLLSICLLYTSPSPRD